MTEFMPLMQEKEPYVAGDSHRVLFTSRVYINLFCLSASKVVSLAKQQVHQAEASIDAVHGVGE